MCLEGLGLLVHAGERGINQAECHLFLNVRSAASGLLGSQHPTVALETDLTLFLLGRQIHPFP